MVVEVVMTVARVAYEDELWLSIGGPQQRKFRYRIERSMTKEIASWLHETFGGFGMDYYYSHGEIWFMRGNQVTLFLLRWP